MSTLLADDLQMVIDRLFIGNLKASEDAKRLKLLKITHILGVC